MENGETGAVAIDVEGEEEDKLRKQGYNLARSRRSIGITIHS